MKKIITFLSLLPMLMLALPVPLGQIGKNTLIEPNGITADSVTNLYSVDKQSRIGLDNGMLSIWELSGYETNVYVVTSVSTNFSLRQPGLSWSTSLVPPSGTFRPATSNECDILGVAYDAFAYVPENEEIAIGVYVITFSDGFLWRGSKSWTLTNVGEFGLEAVGDDETTRGTVSFSRWIPEYQHSAGIPTESDIEGMATTNWVNAIQGVYHDIATNLTYHIVVSNGNWLIIEN